jgi:hypothetical protein
MMHANAFAYLNYDKSSVYIYSGVLLNLESYTCTMIGSTMQVKC